MNLDSLTKSPTEMSKEELLTLVRKRRKSRFIPKEKDPPKITRRKLRREAKKLTWQELVEIGKENLKILEDT